MNVVPVSPKLIAIAQWLLLTLLIGGAAGSASAFFLVSLDWVTKLRELQPEIIWLLPIGGLFIGLAYHYYGQSVVAGNNLILQEYDQPKNTIPLKMAPLVLIGTLITHLFGGSAGREGTAVQMGAAIADQFTHVFKLEAIDRKTILIMGISGGFAAVFGTPLAGALFALEVVYFSGLQPKSIIWSFITAYVAHYTVLLWSVSHTHYHIPQVPEISMSVIFWVVGCSILFGFASMLFSRSTKFWSLIFSLVTYSPLRPFIGGIVIASVVYAIDTTKYIGLGIPMLTGAFVQANAIQDFAIKILFTSFTLGAGFKGGEVTPLFIIGATLGSALSVFVPLPLALLAGMGFVAVFSGATHTPIACSVMGIELFGIESGMYIALACAVAYLFSGSVGIYKSQILGGPKMKLYQLLKLKF
ncbi:chloride channel protein [Flavobacterium turcicum]|uniref:Chloride channel protein n=1 Tax=Flavobacterium turcicum TaxID=2764718 RepID=A0ABR7JG11_9FLAO|nr:chloride channel protein [Flavobacterium turcicum]MBC5863431.1 chloride channel protein [Flavobacterium turcicum]NHL02619.1 chloride channel protein [Flavobacterium turcicum]